MLTPHDATHTANYLERNAHMPIILIVVCASLSLEIGRHEIVSGIHSTWRRVVLLAVCMYNIFGTFGFIYSSPIRGGVRCVVGGSRPY